MTLTREKYFEKLLKETKIYRSLKDLSLTDVHVATAALPTVYGSTPRLRPVVSEAGCHKQRLLMFRI